MERVMSQSRNPKKILSGEAARSQLLYGAELLARTVTRTMGPKSGVVILDRFAGLLATKDGVTVRTWDARSSNKPVSK